jgi:AcrR family transcriptional regulator
MTNTDRRYLRTERLLVEAMLALIAQQPFSSITVERIVEEADIAKKTFYAHYEDKHALLWQSLLYHFEQLEEATNPLEPDTLLMDNKPLSYPVFKHVHDFATFYREMLVQGEDARFIGQFLETLAQQSYRKHQPLRDVAPFMSVPAELIADLLAGALLGTLRWWLKGDMQDSPETMAYRFSQLVAPGVLQSMGLDG